VARPGAAPRSPSFDGGVDFGPPFDHGFPGFVSPASALDRRLPLIADSLAGEAFFCWWASSLSTWSLRPRWLKSSTGHRAVKPG
jgi:hypothetical protein